MITGERSDDLILFIQHRIGAETALDHGIPDVVDIIRQMKELQVFRTGDPPNGDRLEDQPGGTICVVGADDQAGGAGTVPVLFAERGAAENQAGSTCLDRLVCN